jgi:hypothetical protein
MPWTTTRIVAYSALVAVVYFGTQLATLMGVGIALALARPGPNVDAWLEGARADGLVLSVATIASALICVPLILRLVGRREASPRAFLGLRPCPRRTLLLAALGMALFVAASDGLTVALGRSVVPPFMTTAYATARSPVLLLVALVVAAPLVEELFFRGFLVSTLTSVGAVRAMAVVPPSMIWAAVHVHYDLYGMTTVFVLGLLLAGARVASGSLWPPLLMHALGNAVALAEAALTAWRFPPP